MMKKGQQQCNKKGLTIYCYLAIPHLSILKKLKIIFKPNNKVTINPKLLSVLYLESSEKSLVFWLYFYLKALTVLSLDYTFRTDGKGFPTNFSTFGLLSSNVLSSQAEVFLSFYIKNCWYFLLSVKLQPYFQFTFFQQEIHIS